MKNVFFPFVALILLIGCNSNKHIKENNVICIDASVEPVKNLNLSQLGNISQIIPLETNEQSLIGNIDKILFHNDKIIILDTRGSRAVLVYNSEGKFIRKIGKIGRGKGEYTTLNDVCIDKKNEILYLLVNQSQILVYNITGKHIRTIKTDLYTHHFELLKEQEKLCFSNANQLIITDLNGKKIENYDTGFKLKNYNRVLLKPFSHTPSKLLYRSFLDNTIYSVDENGINPYKQFFFGDKTLTPEMAQQLDLIETKKEFKKELGQYKCQIKYYTENSDFIYALFFYEKDPYICLYDKNQDKSIVVRYINLNDDLLFNEYAPLLEYTNEVNEFVFILNSESILKTIDHIKNGDLKTRLNNLINTNAVSIESNPIIFTLKLTPHV